MAEVKVITVPEEKDDKDVTFKYEKILEDRNKSIAKDFGMDPLDVQLKLYFSKGAIVSALGPNGDSMGVFSGYVDGSNDIMIVHPATVDGLFTDVDREMIVLTDLNLIKMYLCKRYYPNDEDYKLYYKYVADVLSRVLSGKFKADVAKFDIKMYDESKKFKKDQELGMILWIMIEKSGAQFIFDNLDVIMKDCDIRKSVFTIYKKSFNDLIDQVKKEVLDVEKQFRNVRGK